MTALSLHQVTQAIQKHWRDQFDSAIPTLYPGSSAVDDAAPAWVELWVQTFRAPPLRRVAPDRLELLISAHCFARPMTDQLRIAFLTDSVRGALRHQTFVAIDDLQSTQTYITLYEPEILDMTRDLMEETGQSYRHMLVHSRAAATIAPL